MLPGAPNTSKTATYGSCRVAVLRWWRIADRCADTDQASQYQHDAGPAQQRQPFTDDNHGKSRCDYRLEQCDGGCGTGRNPGQTISEAEVAEEHWHQRHI